MRRRAHHLLLGAAVAGLALTAVSGATAADKYLIVPGQSIGPVKIGSTQIQVSRAWGAPNSKKKMGKVASWRWGTAVPLNHPRVVLFLKTGPGSPTAGAVSTGDMLFHTAEGITPRQSSTADVLAAYPTATCDDTEGVCRLVGPAGRLTTFSLTDGENPSDPKLVIEITVGKGG